MKKIISILIIILVFITACNFQTATEKQSVELYFLSSDSSEMEVEMREIPVTKDTLALLTAVTNELLAGPVLPEHKRVISAEAKLVGISLDKKIATVNMSENFESGSDVERLWSRYTLVNTLCSIKDVDKIRILINGEEVVSIATGQVLGALGKDDIITEQPPAENNVVNVTLYFSDANAMYLIPEQRSIAVKDNEGTEQIIVSEIIKGPESKSNFRTVTADVKVLSVETKGGVCFVNLSQEFVTKNTGGSTKEGLAIYSIVNSLCKLETVDKVQFLIEGQKIETFGQSIFNESFVEEDSYYLK